MSRFEVIECASDPSLWIIWDSAEQQVIDVMTEEEVAAYQLQDEGSL